MRTTTIWTKITPCSARNLKNRNRFGENVWPIWPIRFGPPLFHVHHRPSGVWRPCDRRLGHGRGGARARPCAARVCACPWRRPSTVCVANIAGKLLLTTLLFPAHGRAADRPQQIPEDILLSSCWRIASAAAAAAVVDTLSNRYRKGCRLPRRGVRCPSGAVGTVPKRTGSGTENLWKYRNRTGTFTWTF